MSGKKGWKEVTSVIMEDKIRYTNAKNNIDKITWETQTYNFDSTKKDQFSSHLIPERLKWNNSDLSITALK